MYKCNKCNKEYENKHAFLGHCSSHSRGDSFRLKRQTKKSICKKNINHECKFCNKHFDTGQRLGGHINKCKQNPEYEIKLNAFKKKIKEKPRKKHSNETKDRLSEIMKQRHKDGTAWNIGKSRWNNKPSYPEQFFMEVIQNEFNDKNYAREYSVGNFSIDFAWIDKKKAIEIDGEQHYRFTEYINRDKRKNKKLKTEGWELLRIRWIDMMQNTKHYINVAKKFIDE